MSKKPNKPKPSQNRNGPAKAAIFLTLFAALIAICNQDPADAQEAAKPEQVAQFAAKVEPVQSFCEFTYKPKPGVVICSRVEADERVLKQKVELVEQNYDKLAGLPVKHLDKISRLVIIVLTPEELNDREIFHDEQHHSYLGRYYADEGVAYITPSGLLPHNTDLAHELVHHLNAANGIKDNQQDEELAYRFEKIYGRLYSY